MIGIYPSRRALGQPDEASLFERSEKTLLLALSFLKGCLHTTRYESLGGKFHRNRIFTASLRVWDKEPHYQEREPGDRGRRGNRKDPRPNDILREPPAHGFDAMKCSDPGDGTCNRVRRGNRQTQVRWEKDGQRRRRLRTEAASRFQPCDTSAHSAHNTPPSAERTQANRGVRRKNHPHRDVQCRQILR